MNNYPWHELITPQSLPFTTNVFKVLQTHISYIFITDNFVYKIKKPVDFGFLDFTTLEKRLNYCQLEVSLNRRLCPDVYLGVVPVTKLAEHFYLEGKGEVVDYAVKMRRLPEEGMMTKLLAGNAVTTEHIDLLVARLVPFYREAKTDEEISRYGSLEFISYNVEENFAQTKDFVGLALRKGKFDHIVNYSRGFMQERARLFEKRVKEGFIKDGHGDLYSANICFDDLREVYIFDCIEFNDRFRCGDVCSDLAFLAMDLDYHRQDGLSSYFIEQYVKKSVDSDLIHLLDFYKCYRAYVRGKIGCFTSQDEHLSKDQRGEALRKAQRYFDLAFRYAGGAPLVVFFMGLSCTGKSYLAEKFAEKYPVVVLSSDVERKRLLGLDPSQHHYADFEKGIYSPEITELTYEALAERARVEVLYGRDVVIDATLRKRSWREKLLKGLQDLRCQVFFVWCTADDEVVKKRFLKRATEKTFSDALFETYLQQKRTFEPPEELSKLIKVDTSKDPADLLSRIEDFLRP